MPKLRDFKKFLVQEDGPNTVEYAMILASMIAVCIAAVIHLTTKTGDSFESSSEAISGAISN